MVMKTNYRGFTIQSAPRFQESWLKWQPHIEISVQDPRGVYTRVFSAEVLFSTMQEADLHGIALAQRLIDGKVKGQSVADLKKADRRATPRFRVQFRTTFSSHDKADGMGVMRNLSVGGCRIESLVTVRVGVTLELRIYVPDLEWPLLVEGASVQWVRGLMFGVVFVQRRDEDRERMKVILSTLKRLGLTSSHGLPSRQEIAVEGISEQDPQVDYS